MEPARNGGIIMAETKKTQKNTNKSNTQSSGKKSTRKKKKSSDDTMKFLLVLVIAGIAIALIFFSGNRDKTDGVPPTGTPTPVQGPETPEPTMSPVSNPTQGMDNPEATLTPEATAAPQETSVPQETSAPKATLTPEPTATAAPTATTAPTSTPTPTPAPALSAAEAEKVVTDKVDTSAYDVQLVNENLVVGNGRYYQFAAIKNQEIISPFLVVNQLDGSLHFYDSTEETVFDFTKFPLKEEVSPTPVPTLAPVSRLTPEEAYQVLCTYKKDALGISKEVKEYDAEYDDELTWIDGVDCYRINLSEFSNGKVRNRGEFYVSVDGTKCYYIDSNTNEFVQAVK